MDTQKRWKDIVVAAFTSVLLTLAPLLFFEGGIIRNIGRVIRNVALWEDIYSSGSLAFNHSLQATLLTLSKVNLWGLGGLFENLYQNWLLVFLPLLLLCCIALFFGKIDQTEIVLLATALMSTSVGFVGGYALSVYFLFIISVAMTPTQMSKWSRRVVAICLAIQMAPKGIPIRFWNTEPAGDLPTYSSLLGGPTSLLIILTVVSGSMLRRTVRPTHAVVKVRT